MEVGESLKLKEKLKNWLFADEIKRIQILETCYKNQIEWCKDRADESYRTSERARLSYQRSEKEVEECRKLLTQICDIGTDVGFTNEEHSWAVICVAGKPEYVKFLPLNEEDTRRVMDFLKQFQYSRHIIDSPLAFRSMVRDRIL